MQIQLTLTREQVDAVVSQYMQQNLYGTSYPPIQVLIKDEPKLQEKKKRGKGKYKLAKKRGNVKHHGFDAWLCSLMETSRLSKNQIQDWMTRTKEFAGIPLGTLSSRLFYLKQQKLLEAEKRNKINYYTTTPKGAKYGKSN
jgi:hypothetical protein